MKEHETEENPYSLSVGDLMAAILFVFVLLLAVSMLKISQQEKSIEQIAYGYSNTRDRIYKDMKRSFDAETLKKWGAEIDSVKLSIRFSQIVMFDNDKYEIKEEFKIILNEFLPKYSEILEKYKNSISEIRIEGHTSSTGGYFHNMELSQNRSREVFKYWETEASKEKHSIKWMHQFVTANGLSYSHPILDKNGKEDEGKSRRVEFRIITQSEESIKSIIEKLNDWK